MKRTQPYRLPLWRDPIILLAGFVSLLALLAFLGIADIVFKQRALIQLDTVVAVYLHQCTTPLGIRVMKWVSALAVPGVPLLGIVVALLLAFRRMWAELIFWSVAIAGAYLLNWWLKIAYDMMRPPVADPLELRLEWGFPSGHALAALVAYGMLGILLWGRVEKRVQILLPLSLVSLILLIGFSRLYVESHYLGDVLAGYAVGISWLALCGGAWRAYRLGRNRASSDGRPQGVP